MAKKKAKKPASKKPSASKAAKPKAAKPKAAKAKAPSKRFLALKEKFFGPSKGAKAPAGSRSAAKATTKATAKSSAKTTSAKTTVAEADAIVQASMPGVRIVKTRRTARTSDAAPMNPAGAVPLSELKRKYTNQAVKETTDVPPPLKSTVVHFNYGTPKGNADSPAVDIGEKVAVVRGGKTRMVQG